VKDVFMHGTITFCRNPVNKSKTQKRAKMLCHGTPRGKIPVLGNLFVSIVLVLVSRRDKDIAYCQQKPMEFATCALCLTTKGG